MPSARRSPLRTRLTWLLVVPFGAVALTVVVALVGLQSATLQRQLDASLQTHAGSEVLTAIDREDHRPHLHEDPIHVPGASGALTKYAALYGRDGAVLAHTGAFRGAVPALTALPGAGAFDLVVRGRRLRAVRVPMGSETVAHALLLAVPREGLDAALRAQVLVGSLAFAVALVVAWALAAALALWLTRDLSAIATTARAVAEGALDARVGHVGGAREIRALAQDLDDMIARLAAVVGSQRRFVSDAAHELRSPLTALRGDLELALRRPRSAEEYRETLERAHGDVLALASLADDLLALARARTETGRGRRAQVSETVAAVEALVGPRAEASGVTLAVEGEASAAVAMTPRDLTRVLRNLVENAVRFAPRGTAVRVSVDAAREGQVRLVVQDQGPGIELAQAERVFEPFVRLDPARTRDGGGAGLGLAIARELCRSHGGDVTLDVTAPPPGARFVVRLPSAAPEQG